MLWLKLFGGTLAVLGALGSLGLIILLSPQWGAAPMRTALRTTWLALAFAACFATFVTLAS